MIRILRMRGEERINLEDYLQLQLKFSNINRQESAQFTSSYTCFSWPIFRQGNKTRSPCRCAWISQQRREFRPQTLAHSGASASNELSGPTPQHHSYP